MIFHHPFALVDHMPQRYVLIKLIGFIVYFSAFSFQSQILIAEKKSTHASLASALLNGQYG